MQAAAHLNIDPDAMQSTVLNYLSYILCIGRHIINERVSGDDDMMTD